MLIYALDPGDKVTALTILDEDFKVVDYYYLPNQEIYDILLANEDEDDHLAIEWLQSYGQAVGQSVFITCRWVGRFEVAWGDQENTFLYARPSIISHLTGGVRGKGKSQINQSLILRFGGHSRAKKGDPLYGLNEHGRDAMAVGVYHLDGIKQGADLTVDWARMGEF